MSTVRDQERRTRAACAPPAPLQTAHLGRRLLRTLFDRFRLAAQVLCLLFIVAKLGLGRVSGVGVSGVVAGGRGGGV